MVKQEGKANDLIERIKADKYFEPILAELDDVSEQHFSCMDYLDVHPDLCVPTFFLWDPFFTIFPSWVFLPFNSLDWNLTK